MTPENTGKIVSMSKEVHIRVHTDLAPFYRFSDGQSNLSRFIVKHDKIIGRIAKNLPSLSICFDIWLMTSCYLNETNSNI
ncbi:zinc/cadmium resistance protein isoform X1 [Vespula squamosa]|uniref:Zinc/cadmium resistance protein isoform X1 n=1 Tax=Vespula squamosa TaxID=30214 RepID=A0ABD2A6Q1_VESSQ